MNADRLTITIEATHQSLEQRLEEATREGRASPDRRERQARIDGFTAATSRHLAAVEEVLVAEACRRAGAEGVATYLAEARHLEQALARLKARLYGEQHVADLPWPVVWDDVRDRLRRHNQAELALVQQLVEFDGDGDGDGAGALADAVYRAEVRAPTRAHPYIPHTGRLGHVVRRVWSYADRFWDTAEGRVVPAPVRPHPHDHSHDSLVRQYLTGEPQLDAEAPLLGPRHRGHRRLRAGAGTASTPKAQAGRVRGARSSTGDAESRHAEQPTQEMLRNLR